MVGRYRPLEDWSSPVTRTGTSSLSMRVPGRSSGTYSLALPSIPLRSPISWTADNTSSYRPVQRSLRLPCRQSNFLGKRISCATQTKLPLSQPSSRGGPAHRDDIDADERRSYPSGFAVGLLDLFSTTRRRRARPRASGLMFTQKLHRGLSPLGCLQSKRGAR
jgi:hypothetical protein